MQQKGRERLREQNKVLTLVLMWYSPYSFVAIYVPGCDSVIMDPPFFVLVLQLNEKVHTVREIERGIGFGSLVAFSGILYIQSMSVPGEREKDCGLCMYNSSLISLLCQ